VGVRTEGDKGMKGIGIEEQGERNVLVWSGMMANRRDSMGKQ
jgi:hypothetical protein